MRDRRARYGRPMTDIAFLPAKRLAAMVRRGQIGAVELLDHVVARVERLDIRINAIVVRDLARARKLARKLDRKRDKGGAAGPLAGVPMTVKESFDIEGLPTTWGYEDRRTHRAQRDALAVARLRAAGAVIFGKSNVPVALADWQSFNPVYGSTSNPWNADHTPGGSSGGGAAAIAAGLSALELGSDIGGSIRVPAHYCGVFGHKPTWGLLPMRGHALAGPGAPTDISVIGPLARSADDLAISLDVLAGPDPEETDLRLTLPPPRARLPSELRIAVWSGQPGHETDAETTAAIEDAARTLRRAGARVSLTARPDFEPDEAFALYLRLLDAALSGRASADYLERVRARARKLDPADQGADAIMARAVDMPHRDWLALHHARHRLKLAWAAFFRDWDALLCPAIATPALAHMQDGETHERRLHVNGRRIAYNAMLFWPGLTGVAHLPATAVPLGLSRAGLPIGAQVAGPPFGDRTTIAVARMLEREGHAFVPPPGWE